MRASNFCHVATAALLAVALTAIAQSSDQTIDIKGIRIGMTTQELGEKFPTWAGFTVAGVRGKPPSSPVSLQFREDRLDTFTFFFDPNDFNVVLSAIKEKYPQLRCESSAVANAMGATFEQITCTLDDPTSWLRLTRYIDLQTSTVSMVSKRFFDELLRKRNQQKKDL